jgi:hypothetical protein
MEAGGPDAGRTLGRSHALGLARPPRSTPSYGAKGSAPRPRVAFFLTAPTILGCCCGFSSLPLAPVGPSVSLSSMPLTPRMSFVSEHVLPA